MKIKAIVLWWLVNGKDELLTEDDRRIETLMPLVSALFPGINYFSVSGFHQVMHRCVIPAVKKQFSNLLGVAVQELDPEEMVEVTALLPSNGYQWKNDTEWRTEFQRTLEAN